MTNEEIIEMYAYGIIIYNAIDKKFDVIAFLDNQRSLNNSLLIKSQLDNVETAELVLFAYYQGCKNTKEKYKNET